MLYFSVNNLILLIAGGIYAIVKQTNCSTITQPLYNNYCTIATTKGEKMKKVLQRILEVQGDNSVAGFARDVGLTQQTVANYMSGRQKPSLRFIYKICCRFNVSADYLLGLSEYKYSPNSISPEVKAEFAKKDEEIKNLKGIIEGLNMALATLKK